MLKENEYQESTISKIFLKNYEQSQLASVKRQTDVQEQEIRMSIRLQYVEGTSEKLRYKIHFQHWKHFAKAPS